MSREGAEALKSTIKTMKVEVPLLTMTTEFVKQIAGKGCNEIYEEELGFSED